MKKGINIAEHLEIRAEYIALGKELSKHIVINDSLQKKVIAIGGESGCGKSTTALCLQKALHDTNRIKSTILHLDSYFKLPPKDNHNNRVKSLDNVGPHELNMSLIDDHITAFRNNEDSITIPIVNYIENNFTSNELDISKVQVLIIEGVYSFLLNDLDHKIFLSRTYKETYENRIKRTRETYDPLVEKILEIEHRIVSPMIEEAEYIIDENYSLRI